MILPFLLTYSLSLLSPPTSFSLNVGNIESTQGQLLVAVYDRSDGYMDIAKARFKKSYSISSTGSIRLTLPELPAGTYAITCVHDLNGNGTIDKNWAGVPTEPYGFSNGVRPKFRAPTWEESKFWFSGQTVQVKVERW
jgi:uncharacterized protein (DUF2141 family)